MVVMEILVELHPMNVYLLDNLQQLAQVEVGVETGKMEVVAPQGEVVSQPLHQERKTA